jgi:hypothetical protein
MYKSKLLFKGVFFAQVYIGSTLIAQPAQRLTAVDYINAYSSAAVIDMKLTGVPASITLAQGMFESDYGNSPLAKEANNHFGIKCHKEWNGKRFIQDDDEKNECFRVYESVQHSYDDHSNFLKTRTRYAFLFKLEPTDYKGWAKGLKQAGYATNPEYAHRIIKLIEENNLAQFDRPAAIDSMPSIASKNNNDKPAAIAYNLLLPQKTFCDDIPYAIATKGDTWYKLAKDNDITLAEIFKYNDASTATVLRQGMLVYLKPKHNRSQINSHQVIQGESLWYIAQLYGVKLKKLARYNQIEDASVLVPGTFIKLR